MNANPSNRKGSALLVTLLVVSLLMVIVLTFTVYVRLELRTVQDRMLHLEARHNAKLAMHLGLAQLQNHAGNDQRATARAEILGSSVTGGNRFWTGVWETNNPSSPPIWLVSGNSPDPIITDGDVVLVGSESVGNQPEEFVSAPEIVSGRIAYSWHISDEGVKANIAPVDAAEDINVPGYSNAEDGFTHRDSWRLDKARKLGSPISDIQPLITSASRFTHQARTPAEASNRFQTRQILSRIGNLQDAAIQWPVPVNLNSEFTRDHFHQLTAGNRSVLSNPLDGGLKQDLSHLKRLSSRPSQSQLDSLYDSPQWDYLTPSIWEFINFERLNEFGNLDTESPLDDPKLSPDLSDDFIDSPVSFHTAPIPTEFSWIAGLGIRSTRSGVTRDVYLYFYNTLEMLNPYTWNLATDNGFGAWPRNPGDLQVRITGFPTIRIQNLDKNRAASFDLSNLVVAVHSNSYFDHAPGFMRTNFSPTSSYDSITGNNTGVYAIKIGEFPIVSETRDDFVVTFGTSDLQIEIGEANTHARTTSERQHWAFFLDNTPPAPGVPTFAPANDPSARPETLQTYTLRNWGNFTIDYPGSNDDTRFVHGGSNMERSRIRDTINFGIHGKLVDEWPQVDELTLMNEQALDALFTYTHPMKKRVIVDMNAPELGDGEFFDFRRPTEITRSAIANTDDTFHGNFFGSSDNNRIARLFDLPNGEILSVGVFNQLLFDGFSYQPLGNLPSDREPPTITGGGGEPGESLHNFFDRYFFSSLPRDVDQWNGTVPLPNQRIVKASTRLNDSPLSTPQSASELFVKGGFNINSLSVPAWTAFLHHSRVEAFSYIEYDDSRNDHFRRSEVLDGIVFFTHPYGGDYHVKNNRPLYKPRFFPEAEVLMRDFGTNPAHEAFIQGYRELSSSQLADLAEAIVTELKEYTETNQTPFTTLTGFLNHGVLQNAIDRVEELNMTSNGRVPTLSPGYFGVGSILNHLAPLMFTRSDTFIIRSSGKVRDPSTNNILSTTYLETKVQRMPDEKIPGYGRRFRIIESKWVDVTP